MSDRPTPETEILYNRLLAENPGNFIHLEEFLELARRLERERDEARAQAKKLEGAYEDATNYYARWSQLIEERDEARTERDILKLVDPAWPVYIQQLERERDEWAAMCGRYKQERDEARLDKRGG
jgi:uncharacterized coiled-coil DUF342 family protein